MSSLLNMNSYLYLRYFCLGTLYLAFLLQFYSLLLAATYVE